jgi:histone deacetylase complex subunit SAP18
MIRTFIKQHPGHRTTYFDSGELPAQDEIQLYTWSVPNQLTCFISDKMDCRMDATLQELLITLRALSSPSPLLNASPEATVPPTVATTFPELHHASAKYVFRAVYPDPSAGGRFQSKELGVVYAKDLSDPSIFNHPFQKNSELDSANQSAESDMQVQDSGTTKTNGDAMDVTENVDAKEDTSQEKTKTERELKTLQDMRFHRGDYLSISVVLPKSSASNPSHPTGTAPGLNIRGSAINTRGPPSAGRGDFGATTGRQIPWVTNSSNPDRSNRGIAPRGRGQGNFSGRRDTRDDKGKDKRSPDRSGRPGVGTGRGRRSRSRSGSRSKSRSRDQSMASSRSRRRSRSSSPRR